LLADFLLVFKPGRSVSLSQWNVHQLVRQAMPEFAKKFDEEIKRAGIK